VIWDLGTEEGEGGLQAPAARFTFFSVSQSAVSAVMKTVAPTFIIPSRLMFLAAVMSLALLAGCATAGPNVKDTNDALLVFGARLGVAGVPDGLAGVPSEETPCLKGRDFSYEARDILIGYGHDARIRKVVTRNPDTSIYGIRPGDEFATAEAKVLVAGFRETGAKHRYGNECCLLTLSVDEAGHVFGLMLELRD
jgi:hypothetical protein